MGIRLKLMVGAYDKAKVGKRIASGADRVVYRYGNEQVIKFSSFSYIVGKNMRNKMVRDYEICKKYFGDFVVETIETNASKSSRYIEIQPFIKGKVLSRKNARTPKVHAQLKALMEGMEQMEKDGYAPIDLMGHAGFINVSLNNVFVDEAEDLRIIDATLFESKSVGGIGWLMVPFFPATIAFQKFILKRLLGK